MDVTAVLGQLDRLGPGRPCGRGGRVRALLSASVLMIAGHVLRLRAHLPWAAALALSALWLRHTPPLTWVERTFSYAVARADAGTEGATPGAGGDRDSVDLVAARPQLRP